MLTLPLFIIASESGGLNKPKTQNNDQSCQRLKILDWELLPNHGELTFVDYAYINDDISVQGALTDTELFDLTPLEEDAEENEGQSPIPVTY